MLEGFETNVQAPAAGKSYKITLPEGLIQVGWVIIPTEGETGFDLTSNKTVWSQPSIARM
jgi:hypothetical protein